MGTNNDSKWPDQSSSAGACRSTETKNYIERILRKDK